MHKKRLLSPVLFATALALFLLWSVAFAADESTSYVDENGNTQTVTATVVDASTDTLTDGRYVVKGNFTRNGTITVSGDARLILADGASLTINGSANYAGVNVSGGNSLTIYGQEAGTGKLTATGGANGAGIGAGFNQDVGTIVIRGGEITANGKSDGGAGIGGGLTIFGKAGGTIIISGGKVNATGSGGGAGIGSGAEGDENFNPVGGTIIIRGGEVTAAGGNNAAGIGGGRRVSAGSITISGGKVNVTGGDYAAAIGGGLDSDGGNVEISGGTVFARATSAYHYVAIGSGLNGAPGTIIIDGGSVKTDGGMSSTPQNSDGDTVCYTGINLQGMSEKRVVLLTTEACSYGIKDVYTDDFNYLHLWLPAGKKITAAHVTDDAAIPTCWFFEGEVAGGTPAGFLFQQAFIVTSVETGYTYQDDLLTFTQPGDYTISMVFGAITRDRIRVNVPSSSGTVNITLDNVKIDASSVENATAFDMAGANVNLKLVGTNSLSSGERRAGLLCPYGASLTITADSSGSLTATGGLEGAGIGGVDLVSGGNITINGGTVTANSGGYAAGIGSGFMWDLEQIYVNRSNITINGGIVTANGGSFGAGIGGGPFSGSGKIVINNGKVTANGGEWGAGIGGGEYASPYNNNNTDITINGGEVQAHGGAMAAGIGGGAYSGGGVIRISGGKVTAVGGPHGIRENEEISGGAGIGSGGNRLSAGSYGSTITISGGEVTATGAYHSAGIGGAEDVSGGTIAIEGGKVTANGGTGAAGIGGGYYGSGGTIAIESGEVTANGGILGAGIGSGYYKNSGNITIEGGTIWANGGGGAAGIGAGHSGSGNSITIQGGTVTATGGSHDDAFVGGAGIGSGGLSLDSANYTSGGTIIIEGGTVTASGGRSGAGIGGGSHGHGGSITISGGTVTATGGQNQGETTGAGIGGGEKGSGEDVVISGGSVKASGYEAIGKGKQGSNSGSRTNGNGKTVHLNTLTLLGALPDTKVSAGSINGISCAETPDAAAGVYGIKDVFTDTMSNVYFYLPPSSGNETVQLTAGETTYGAAYRRYDFDTAETLRPLSDVTFTAEQVGGAGGTADSTGIKLTFSQDVDWFSESDVTIENGTGRVTRGELTGSGNEWTIALSEVEAEGTVIVSVRNFGSYNIATPPQTVTVYKATAATPSAPRNLFATPGDGQVTLGWEAPASDGGAPIIKYEVSKDGGANWSDAESDTGHTFFGLTNGQSYTFKVRAVNIMGEGEAASVTATPEPPKYDLISITQPSPLTYPNGTPLDEITLPAAVGIVTEAGGPTSSGVSWDKSNISPAYDPSSPLAQTFSVPGTVTLPANVTNTNGISLQVSISVTVEAATSSDMIPPAVTGVAPSGTGVSISGSIEIRFSEEMSTSTGKVSLDGGLTTLTGGSWNADKTVYTVPYSGLAYNTVYIITIFGFKDDAGNEMVTDSSHSFTTVAAPAGLPTVTTGTTVKGITSSGARVSGSVTSDGGAEVTGRGFVYGKGPDPAIGGAGVTKVAAGSGTGSFTAALTNLEPGTTYYVRAYAANSEGTAYGAVVSFTTEKDYRGDLPGTGHGGTPWIWLLLCGASAAVLVALLVLSKRRKAIER